MASTAQSDAAQYQKWHSTLEVVPPRNEDKEVIPAIINNPYPQNAAPWNPPQSEPRILGLKRRAFFILAWILSIIVAVAASVGASLGSTMRSQPSCSPITQDDAIVNSLSTIFIAATPLPSSTGSTTNTPTSSSTLGVSTLSTTKTSTATGSTPSYGGIGGRCANQWGGDCICLDSGICTNVWKGTPYTGYEGNWPCPNDPNNIMACVVKPCLGKSSPAQCLWREACRQVATSSDSAPICPGEGDFVCCEHSW